MAASCWAVIRSRRECSGRCLREPIKRLVVVNNHDPDRPVGMVTPFDILRVLAEKSASNAPPASLPRSAHA